MAVLEIIAGFIFAGIAIGIIAIVGANAAYDMARDDYECDRERDFAERIKNAHVETRINVVWIDERK